MFKLLITGALVYFIYRFFIAPPAIDRGGSDPTINHHGKQNSGNYEDEYIDYEEVD